MDSNHDKVFVNTFLGVIGFLVALTIVIVTIANMITSDDATADEQAIVRAQIQSRIAPVGVAITDPDAIKVAAPASETHEARTGESIVQGLCGGCHVAGVAGAPKMDDAAAWQARLDAAGHDGLVASVVNGKGAMPPKGGDASLSEEEVREAVDVMLKQAGI